MSALSSTSAVLFSFWNMKWTLTFPIGFQHIERKMQIPPQARVTQRLPPSLAPCSSAVQPQCLPAVPETKLRAFAPAHDILSPQIAAWSFSLIFYILAEVSPLWVDLSHLSLSLCFASLWGVKDYIICCPAFRGNINSVTAGTLSRSPQNVHTHAQWIFVEWRHGWVTPCWWTQLNGVQYASI